MPSHDWSRVHAGIFHHFHLAWIYQIQSALNAGVLPPEYYALAEGRIESLEPDILTLKGLERSPYDTGSLEAPRGFETESDNGGVNRVENGEGGLKLAEPQVSLKVETCPEAYTKAQRHVAIRQADDDFVVAIIEIVSPGNKASRRALRQFVEKVVWLMEHGIHQLIIDVHKPTPRDPSGIHGAIWEELTDHRFEQPEGKPLTLVSYACASKITAYIEPLTVDAALPVMPLFLKPGGHVEVPLKETSRAALDAVPQRWRRVIEEQ